MTTIDERIVSMKFQGEQFLTGVEKSLGKLDQFNAKLKTMDGGVALDKVDAAAHRLGSGALNKIASGVESISGKFKALGVAGVAALSTVTSQAVFAGEQLAKSLTIQPILDGFHEYETNMNSIQTIMANTGAAFEKVGEKNHLSAVTHELDALNTYSDQTIYNFSEMAKNIGTFTAAGVGLKTATASIKGIANLAALSGSNSEQASSAMYQLSQAISSGRVSLEDWNSVVNAGMGGTVFQRALAQNAQKLGTLSEKAVKFDGDMKNVTVSGKSFRESITAKPGQESWLTSKVLTQTLAQFTGDLSNAQLKAQGFNATQIKNIQTQARVAKNAATQVKTLSQLMGTVKESVGSGWGNTFKLIFGDFTEAQGLFTGISNRLGKVVTASANARNKVVGDWKKNGGRLALIDSLNYGVIALGRYLKPLGEAWRSAFPAKTGAQLAHMTQQFAVLVAKLSPTYSTMDKIKRIFSGVFAVLGIGWDILKQVIGLFVRLTGVATEGSGGFLEFAAKIGDFLVNLRLAIQQGKGLENLFKGIGDWLEVPIRAFKLFGTALSNAWDTVGGQKVIDAVDKVSAKLEPMAEQSEKIASGWKKVLGVLTMVWKKIEAIGGWIVSKFAGIGKVVAQAFSGLNFDDIMKGINTGLFAGLVLMIKKWAGGSGGGAGGFLESITGAIEGVTGALKGMQNALNAAALLGIAASIGILALSLNLLAKIDAGGLARGTSAIGAMFTSLVGAMIVLQKFTTLVGVAKLPVIAASFLVLAAAVAVLAISLKLLAGLSWEDLSKGLLGVAGILTMLVVVANTMPKGASFILASVGLIAMSVGIHFLADAVSELSGLSWGDMTKGLTGVGVLMFALVKFANTAKLNVKGMVSGIVVVMMAAAIKTLASALKDISGLSWEEMAKGLVTMSLGLTFLSKALSTIPPKAIFSAAGIMVAALALKVINDTMAKTGTMSLEDIAKGVGVMAGSLGLLAAALRLLKGTEKGSLSLAVAAGSLQLLSVSLQANANLNWTQIAKGMAVMAGSIALLTGAVYAMGQPMAMAGAQALITASGALGILSASMTALGQLSWMQIVAGLVALAGVFVVLGVAGAVLTPTIPAIYALAVAVALIGVAMLAAGAGIALFGAGVLVLALGFAALATAGVAGATAFVGMISVILGGVPTILSLVKEMLLGLLQVVIEAAPKIGEAGVILINTLLTAIDNTSPHIIETILKLLTTLVDKLNSYVPHLVDAGARLLSAFLDGLGRNIGGVIDKATTLIANYLNGIARNLGKVIHAGVNIVIALINGIGQSAVRLADAGMKMIVNFMNGLANAIRSNASAMRAAGLNIAMALIDGMTGGLASGVGKVVQKAKDIAGSAISAAKSVLDINSPSKEFIKIGKSVNEGFVKGLDGDKSQIDAAFKSLRDQISAAYKDSGDDIETLEKKLKKLKNARHLDRDAINDTKKALAQARKEHAAEAKALQYVTVATKNQHAALDKLATKYDVVTDKLKKAQETYANAVKTRDDFNKSITDEFSNSADPTADISTSDYITKLKKQVQDTKTFTNVIQQLRKMGLDDETYKDLLSQGTEALPFMQDLLKGGPKQVKQIADLNKQLDKVGSSLGQTTSKQLYQAAVDSAAGLVKGLANQQKAIEAQMDKIADAMVKAIKKKLGIKSPSRVFAEIGRYSSEGLAGGLQAHAQVAADAASMVGNRAVEAMRVSLSNVDKMVAGNIDVQPTIRPVLDLTDIKKNAGKLGALLPTDKRVSLDGSYSTTTAAKVAGGIRDRQTAQMGTPESQAGNSLAYTQIINSPKAVSPVEVYRGTKNQLSSVKGALSR